MLKYKLRYLPIFYEELEHAYSYIVFDLQNPMAGEMLLDSVENAILERLENPESFERVKSVKERRYPYFRIYIGEYIIYYVVIDDKGSEKIMEVRRFVHRLQERTNV